MKNISEDIGTYMQTRELVMSLLLTSIFLALSFVAYTRLSTTEIVSLGKIRVVHISYYGFPFQMVGILSPLTGDEYLYVSSYEGGLIQILWGGLLINFILYFLLTFFITFLYKRFKG